jgi:hypothetical protein
MASISQLKMFLCSSTFVNVFLRECSLNERRVSKAKRSEWKNGHVSTKQGKTKEENKPGRNPTHTMLSVGH